MKKRLTIALCLLLTTLLFCGTVFALAAAEDPLIKAGETLKGDFIVGGNSVTNDGLIQGDLIAGAQLLSVNGDVEGDIIAGGSDISIKGSVGGSVRVGGNNVNISSTVERNLMAFGNNIVIDREAVVKRNAYIFGATIKGAGTFLGKTDIYGSDVTLEGSYEGDVAIHDMKEGSSLKLLSGTVIKGKLTYMGIAEFQVPSDVRVGSYEYVNIHPEISEQKSSKFSAWNLVKRLFTLIVYYLFALLLYKLFPRFFVRSGDFIGAKPLSAAGIGIATLGSLVGGFLLLIILLLLTLFIFEGSIFFFAGFVFTFVTTVTIFFADIPVSLWLGNTIGGNRLSVPAKLAIGLTTITVIKLVLDILGDINKISTFIGILSFIANAAIWILGTGAMLRIIFEVFKSANIQAQTEETEIEPLTF